MSLLSICQQAAQYAGIQAPTSVIANSQQSAQLLLAAANLAGMAIARRPPGGWVSMIREYDFQTRAGSNYSGTVANTEPSNGWAVVTIVLTPAFIDPILTSLGPPWVCNGTGIPNNAVVVSQVTTIGSSNATYVITLNQAANQTGAGTYQFGQSDYDMPSDFQRPVDNTFWDRSRFWSMRGPQSPQQWQLYKSSVIGKASIQRRYRFRSTRVIQDATSGTTIPATILSIDPVPFDNGAALVFEYVSNGWCQTATEPFIYNTQWQNDTDVGVIDEYLIELETIWRVLRRLGLSYSDEMAEAERQIDKAIAQDGAAGILDMTPNDALTLIGPWNLPETGFGGMDMDSGTGSG